MGSSTRPARVPPPPAENYEAWLQRHQEELRDSRKKSFETPAGIPVETLYTPEHLQHEGWDYQRDVGYPGQAPYTRGFTPGGYRSQLWKMEMYAGFGSAEEANQRYRYLMSQGSTGGISIALDLPTQVGYDSDHPMARDEVGQIGVALTSLDDVERVFDGIPLEKVGHIFSTANAIGPIVCAWLIALYEKRGTPTGDCIVQLQNDPIKEYVARGTQFLPIEAAVKLSCDMIEFCRTAAPEWLPISVSGSHMKQAGATCVQEAAFTICNAIAYVETCLERGMKIDDFGHVLELHFCTEMDFFDEVAKYRATRKVWTKLVRERFGGTTERSQHFRLHAATSGRPLTAQQPLNNIARITLQALAQILGGCEQTRTASFDEALGIPTQEAARTSIRTNQIIGYESGIPDTVDPLGGSYFVEHLTLTYEREIEAIIRQVDAMGGALAAVHDGFYQRALAQGAYREACAIESGEQVVVGVNRFQSDEAQPVPTFKLDPGAAERQVAKLRAVRERRDAAEVQRTLARLREDCKAGVNVMPAVLAAVKAYATIGEIADVWRDAFGTYVPEAVRF
ncbi:methylmalonyl-CoA mutase [Ramlibacter sp. G-1-2-2]|uniref:Methylmalonyl-CoA mutase n=1 Tax=Ramlibacter agri TaxID=2728837 RepID=A0A848H582_9BURK|nr:methylmalonyl-CoA mutase family protein [Ramlibacter agri]NML45724.1 methylmalonyl-CoA mutase [Ramlibacter agri]